MSPADCRRSRGILALSEGAASPKDLSEALGHLAACGLCQARVDQLALAILAAAPEAIPCAECRARLPALLEARSSTGGLVPAAGARSASSADPSWDLVEAHLAACADCGAFRDRLDQALRAAAGDRGVEHDFVGAPPIIPRWDVSFALAGPPGPAPARAGARARARRRWLPWRAAGPRSALPRGALAAAAVLVIALLAVLVRLQPELWQSLSTLPLLRPEARPTATAPAAGPGGAATLLPGTAPTPRPTAGGSRGPGAGPTASPTLRPAAATARAAREAREKERRTGRSTATPTGTATAALSPTPTLAAATREARPTLAPPEPPAPPATSQPPEPPPEPPEDPYPEPAEPDPDPYPGPG